MDDMDIKRLKRIIDKVTDLLDGNPTKSMDWALRPNPGLGGISPRQMVRSGKAEKLEKWVDEQLAMNEGGLR